MASPIGASGSVEVTADDQGSTISVTISEPKGIKSEGLSLSTWGASYVLANQLHRISVAPSSDVIELGAGTGLVGLSAAALWKANVILTDLPAIVPGLQANVSLNRTLLEQLGGKTSAGSLDWTSPSKIILSDSSEIPKEPKHKPQVILAADTIYDEDHPELLCRTITQWLAEMSESRVVFCYPLRMAYIDHIRDFWGGMEAAGFECCDEGREEADETWNEVSHTPYEWCVWRWRA